MIELLIAKFVKLLTELGLKIVGNNLHINMKFFGGPPLMMMCGIFSSFCLPWLPVTCKSWSIDDLCNGVVCLSWYSSWICISSYLQEFRW